MGITLFFRRWLISVRRHDFWVTSRSEFLLTQKPDSLLSDGPITEHLQVHRYLLIFMPRNSHTNR